MIKSILHIAKIIRIKIRSSSKEEGGEEKEEPRTLIVGSINEEYKEAFRTKSYTEICSKVEGQLGATINNNNNNNNLYHEGHSQSLSSPSSTIHLLDYLVKVPHSETLISISDETSKYHHFLSNYFDISLEAGTICESVLQKLHQVRINYYMTIKNVINLINQSPDYTYWTHNQYTSLFKHLAAFSLQTNPFSSMTPNKFLDLRDRHVRLLHQLTSQCREKKAVMRWVRRAVERSSCGGKSTEKRQLDIAARGVYAVMKDLDTMRVLVRILQDQMEHNRSVAERCVAEIECGRRRKIILKQVSAEFRMRDYACFQEHMRELEQQIYLSFLDINRSRKLLLQQLDKSS